MKKMILVFVFIGVMASSFAVPAMAKTAVEQPISTAEYQGIAPATELTKIYHRWVGGRLQFRVWSITNGRWLTDWTYV